MGRLVCAFVVRKPRRQVFSHQGPFSNGMGPKYLDKGPSKWFNPLYSGDPYTGTFANSEDPDEILCSISSASTLHVMVKRSSDNSIK